LGGIVDPVWQEVPELLASAVISWLWFAYFVAKNLLDFLYPWWYF
jgi:hypothetical protein